MLAFSFPLSNYDYSSFLFSFLIPKSFLASYGCSLRSSARALSHFLTLITPVDRILSLLSSRFLQQFDACGAVCLHIVLWLVTG